MSFLEVTSEAAVLRTTRGAAIPLREVRAKGVLNGLVLRLEVEQRYENLSDDSVEAVYTFPLPLSAVLLGLELDVRGKTLTAVAMARGAATHVYEDAIDAGDTAVLLEADGDGLFTVSLGQLPAGQTAVIRYSYVELLDAFEGYVRLAVPTAIAPRYGSPAAAGLSGPTVPTPNALVEYPFTLELVLAGLTDPAVVHSPSHTLEVVAVAGGLQVGLSRPGFLDRDYVLQLRVADLPQQALVAADGDGWAVLASPAWQSDEAANAAVTVKVLLDCSGSMAGGRIEQAKAAVVEFLCGLAPPDQFSLTRFGSTVVHVSHGLEPVDQGSRAALLLLVEEIDADLGGTELASALEATLAIPSPRRADILLITDGEVYGIQPLVKRVASAGHRLFVVAIGAAPNEPLAVMLARETSGAAEFVADTADARPAISRMFKRIRQPGVPVGAATWGSEQPVWTLPALPHAFNGDTIHVAAGFAVRPSGTLLLAVGDGHISCPMPEVDNAGPWLPRLLAARRLTSLTGHAATVLAVQHGLASPHTSLVVVDKLEAGHQALGLPRTIAVPQMFARVAERRTLACMAPPERYCRSGPSLREAAWSPVPKANLASPR